MSTTNSVSGSKDPGVGKYANSGVTSAWATASDGYIMTTGSFAPIGGYYTSGTAPAPPTIAEVRKELAEFRVDSARETQRINTVLMTLTSKIEALSQLIEADTSAQDKKEARRKIAALEEQLGEFRDYYDESQEKIYK